jgi:hypothetical protein
MHVIDLILYIAAAVCFALAAMNTSARVNLIAAGLLAWVLVPAIALIQSLAGS